MNNEEQKVKKPIIQTNEITVEAKATFRKRAIYAGVLLAIFVPCLILGGWPFFILVAVFVGISTYEIAKAPSSKLSWVVWLITFILMYSLVYWTMLKTNLINDWKDFDINTSFSGLQLSTFALATMIGTYFVIVLFKSDEFSVMEACYLIAMTLLLALGFQAILCVRYFPFYYFGKHTNGYSTNEVINATIDISTPTFKYAHSMFLMIYVLLGIFFNDIGAYVTGLFFGKHKMNPKISPKKTWEGFTGGILISLVLTLIFGLTIAYCGMPMLPIFDSDHWYWIVLVSAIIPLVANLGDFAFSAIKRQFNKKDYSKILGPHGGILDRIDSTLFGSIAVVIFITFITNSWNFLV